MTYVILTIQFKSKDCNIKQTKLFNKNPYVIENNGKFKNVNFYDVEDGFLTRFCVMMQAETHTVTLPSHARQNPLPDHRRPAVRRQPVAHLAVLPLTAARLQSRPSSALRHRLVPVLRKNPRPAHQQRHPVQGNEYRKLRRSPQPIPTPGRKWRAGITGSRGSSARV